MRVTSEAQRLLEDLVDKRMALVKAGNLDLPGTDSDHVPAKSWSQIFDLKEVKKSEFKSFGEFAKAVATRKFDERLRAMQESDDSAGGYLVPEQWSDMLMAETLEASIVMPRAKKIGMTGRKMYVPAVEIVDHNGTDYPVMGGVEMEWMSGDPDDEFWPGTIDGADAVEQDPKVRMMTLETKKLHTYMRVSNELLEDSYSVGGFLTHIFTEAMRNYLDYTFLRGSGTTQPLGVLNGEGCYDYTRAVDSQIDWPDIIGMLEHFNPASWNSPATCWLASPSTIDQLYSLAATDMPIWGTISDAKPMKNLLGWPLIITEKLPALGTKGDFMLVDLSQYIIGMRKDITMDISPHEYFRRYVTSFRAICRIDGQPLWPSTMTLHDGTEVSPYVVLDTVAGS